MVDYLLALHPHRVTEEREGDVGESGMGEKNKIMFVAGKQMIHSSDGFKSSKKNLTFFLLSSFPILSIREKMINDAE